MEISIPTFVIQIINFVLFALVLIVFLLKPLQKVIDERRKKIENDFEEAKEAKETAMQIQKDYEAKLKETNITSAEIIANAVTSAENTKKEIIAEANAHADRLRKRILNTADRKKFDAKKIATKKAERASFTPSLPRNGRSSRSSLYAVVPVSRLRFDAPMMKIFTE